MRLSPFKSLLLLFYSLLFAFNGFAQSTASPSARGVYAHLENQNEANDVLSKATAILHNYFGAPEASWHKAFQTRSEALDKTYTIEFNTILSDQSIELYLKMLGNLSGVALAEIIPVYTFSYTPNDLGPSQYSLIVTHAQAAWDLSTGDANIKVAVVDDAFRINHNDLQYQWAVNTGEIPGNGIDDDGNGYIDDVSGWDAADNDNDPNPPVFSDSDWTHGTHVAGIVGADTDNGTGIASIGFNISMIPVKSTNASPSVTHGYEGLDYAINSGAQIISMSWGGPQFSAAGQALADAAYANGILCIAAAGNNNSIVPMYPCNLNHVLCVGATDQNDVRASFSNYGSHVDVMAPGVDIISCLGGAADSYGEMSGTSMATPFVSGLCALMLSQNPMLTPDEVQECLENTCDNINAQNPGYIGNIGAGRVNALQAMLCVSAVYASFESDVQYQCPGGEVHFSDLSMNDPTSWSWTFPGGTPATSTAQNPTVTYNTAGVYDVTLQVSNANGTHTVTYPNYIEIDTPEASITGSTIITDQMDTWLIVEMTGSGPWSIEVSDGTSTTVYADIETSPFQFQVEPNQTTNYTLVAFWNNECAGTMTGQATVTVIPAPEAVSCYYSNIYGDAENNSGQSAVIDPTDFSVYTCGSHNGEAMLSHFNPDGTLDWSRKYTSAETALGLVRAPNGDIIFTASNNTDGFKVIRCNPVGDVIWAKKYSWGYDRFPRITRTLGDTYLIAGWSNFGGLSDNLVVIKVDNNGDLLWEAFFDSVDDQMSSVVPTDDGGCMITGGLHIIGGNLNYFFVRLDADGNTVFKREYDSSPVRDDNPTPWLLSDGSYAMAGQVTGPAGDLSAFISKLDANLNHEWSFRFGGGNGDEHAYDVREDSEGNIVAAFRMRTADAQTKPLFLKFDPDGNLIWAKHQTDMKGARLEHVSPNSFLISAAVTDSAQFGQLDAVIIHEDEDLSSCMFTETTVDLTPITWTGIDWPANEYGANATIVDIIVTAETLDYQMYAACPVDCTEDCDAEADFTLTANQWCAPGEVSFTQIVAEGDLEWALNGEIVSSAANPSITINDPGIHTLTLLASNDECTSIHSETITLSFIDYSLISDTTICAGDSLALWAEFEDGIDFHWSPTTGLANPNSPNTKASPSSSTTYTAHFTNADGCEVTHTVDVLIDPTCCTTWIDIDHNATVCVGEEVWFNNHTLTNGGATWTWQWPAGLGTPQSEGSEPTGIVGTTPGVFPIIVQLDDGCGSTTDTLNISVFALPVADAGADTLLCSSAPIVIGGTPLSYHTYSWSPANNLSNPESAQPLASPSESTSYVLTVEDVITGCATRDTVHLTIDKPLNLGLDYHGCLGDTLHLAPDLVDGTWLWSDGSTGEQLAIGASGTYSLEYENACGIKNDFIIAEFEDCECPVYIPNAFTPNGDGINDLFKPVINCTIRSYSLMILNRQGEVLFESNDPELGWAGEFQNGEHYVQNEVYIWKLEVKGELAPARSIQKITGRVTAIR